MKRQWDIEELIEQFTLVEADLMFLANLHRGGAMKHRQIIFPLYFTERGHSR